MAKIAFSKLGLKMKSEPITASFCNSADEIMQIEIKPYLPVEEKLELIAAVINNVQDENNFFNPTKFEMFFTLEVIFRYTNIAFTDKQKENLPKLYDILASNHIDSIVFNAISDEIRGLYKQARTTAEHIYEYRNSVYGILDAVSTDYSGLDLDAQKIRESRGNADNLNLLKDVLTKMG